MLQTSVRVLRLLTLLQARRSFSAADLATHLEVTERTVRRDVERVRRLGYAVQSTSGPSGGYALAPGAFLPPLMFEDEEGIAVALALQLAVGGSVEGIAGASQRALSKLERVFSERVRGRTKSMRTALVRLADSGPTVGLEVVSALARACSESLVTTFGYRDHHGKASERTVEPHRLVHMDRRFYLLGWDRAKKDWRTFRVDRILPPIGTSVQFTPRPAPREGVEAYVATAVSSGAYTYDVRVLLHAGRDSMRSRISASEGLLEAIDSKRCRLTLGTHSLDTTAVWLAGLGVHFNIEEPEELVARVGAIGERLLRAVCVNEGARRPGGT